jgi:hypothetical protein
MSSRRLPAHILLRGFAVSAAALAVIVALVAPDFLNPRELQAAPAQRPNDPDGDGLVNAQETVLGTNRFLADTDGDNFSDLEELARKTSPHFSESIPHGSRMAVGMSARGNGHELHALISFYLPDGRLQNKVFKAGVLVGSRTIVLSQDYLLNHAVLSLHAARDPNARIATLDLPIEPRFVHYFGHMTVFATLGNASQGIVQAADSILLIAIGPMIVLQMADPRVLGTGSLSGGGGGGSGGSSNVGSIYVPLGADEPGNWTPGEVCVQQTSVIAVSGAMVTMEVTSAECEDGWDGFCPSSCAATVGNTYTTIDPVALIGG